MKISLKDKKSSTLNQALSSKQKNNGASISKKYRKAASKKKLLPLLFTFFAVIALAIGISIFFTNRAGEVEEDKVNNLDSSQIKTPDESQAVLRRTEIDTQLTKTVFNQSGELKDVTKAQEIQGTMFTGLTGGVAKSGLDTDGNYVIYIEFWELPVPKDDNFYEGWIVAPGGEFISTGKIEKVEDQFFNIFTSQIDYSPYTKYVLTLEPNDSDPAPADHIVEGVMDPTE